MPIYLADKTIAKIGQHMLADQGASFRVWSGKILPHMDDAYRGEEEPFRSHMGASLIGRQCAREVWLSWHWAYKKKFDGRMLRLFNRGHLEEARFLAMLQMIGVQTANQDENGKQYRISDCGGHFGGSGDGMGFGLPDLKTGTVCLFEFKTHSDKSFIKLAGSNWKEYVDAVIEGKKGFFKGSGVKVAKPEHYTQMQIYMRKMGYAVTLYAACNKNDDSVYMELVLLDEDHADKYLDLAERLVTSPTPPRKLGNSIGWHECKFCDLKRVCHGAEEPAVNCRTCKYAVPVMGQGEWGCNFNGKILTKQQQFLGCTEYVVNPNLVI